MERRAFLLVSLGSLGTVPQLVAQSQGSASATVPWLHPQSGPFLICVGSFRGEQAREQAQQLALYVQQHYRLRAYLFSRSEEERRKQQEELKRLRELYGPNQRFRRVRIEDEYAVLVGDFRTWEEARRELDRIKQLPPPKDIPLPVMFIVRQGGKPGDAGAKPTGEYATYNPFRYAFVVPNPLAPKPAERVQNKNWDPAWAELNRNNPYSLLKCPRRYTLLVKSYQAPTIITGMRGAPPVLNTNPAPRPAALDAQVEKEMRRLEQILGWKPDAAALQAHNLCEVLRHPSLNYEAYTLHTKEASLVTVGSFDRTDDPNIEHLRQLLAGKTIGVVQLSPNPALLPIPRPE
ncbi:MAG: hypothetical protein RMI91_15055 [Gemmatales bacterium]|nr:hypothetical protein [Gemmatales bacterium]